MNSNFLRMNKLKALILLLASLPILLHVYNPSIQLGGLGLLLGVIGMTVSPIILFFVLFQYVARVWKQ